MLGIFLLCIGLITYFKKKYVISFTIFFCFTLDGFQIITNNVAGAKLGDLAFLYTLIVTLYNIRHTPYYFKKSIFSKYVFAFILLLVVSSIYSLVHYKFSLSQIIQATRDYYIIFSYFFIIRLSTKDVYKLLRIFAIITTIVSIIYICQILIFKQPLLPYDNIDKIAIDPSTGLIRLYNFPTLLYFFLYLSFLEANYFKNKLIKGILFMALLCTLGRIGIATVILMLFTGIFITGKLTANLKRFIIIGIILLPFASIIANRFSSGEQTSGDLDFILKGDMTSMNMDDFTKTGATLAYRFAWVYERLDYLIERDNSELYFGLGMISDNQPKAQKMYNFMLGLNNKDTNTPFQLGTPDIAWGNILCRFGLIGVIFYIFFWTGIILKLWDSNNMFLTCGVLYIATYCLTSIACSTISYTTFMTFAFLLMALKENACTKKIYLPQ